MWDLIGSIIELRFLNRLPLSSEERQVKILLRRDKFKGTMLSFISWHLPLTYALGFKIECL